MRVPGYRSVSKCCVFLFLAAAIGAAAVWFAGIRPAPLVADEPQAAGEIEKGGLELWREVQRLREEVERLTAEVQRLNAQLNAITQAADRLAREVLTRAEADVSADQASVPEQASANDKYSHLLRKIAAPEDLQSYGEFYDWGYWSGTSWQGHTDLPPGYWVYVFPHWYIWRDCRGEANPQAL